MMRAIVAMQTNRHIGLEYQRYRHPPLQKSQGWGTHRSVMGRYHKALRAWATRRVLDGEPAYEMEFVVIDVGFQIEQCVGQGALEKVQVKGS